MSNKLTLFNIVETKKHKLCNYK